MTQTYFNFNHNILCVGDLMLDEYIFGDTNRISPEAPVPVINHHDTIYSLGGVGNVARNLVSLQAGQVSLFGIVGVDNASEQLARLAELAQVKLHAIIDDKFRTVQKLRVISRHQQLLRVDFERPYDLEEAQVEAVINSEQFAQALDQAKAVVLSDYNKGIHNLFPAVIAKANEQGKFTFVDPKAANWVYYVGASLIKPNYREFVEAVRFNFPEVTQEQLVNNEGELAIELMRRYAISAMVITKAEQGMSIYLQDGQNWNVATAAEEVYDVTGAGDTTIATIVLAFLTIGDLPTACAIAARAAAISISKVGTAAVSNEELFNACRDFISFVDDQGNLLDLQAMEATAEQIYTDTGATDVSAAQVLDFQANQQEGNGYAAPRDFAVTDAEQDGEQVANVEPQVVVTNLSPTEEATVVAPTEPDQPEVPVVVVGNFTEATPVSPASSKAAPASHKQKHKK